MVSTDQLGFALGQVKRSTVTFGKGARNKNNKAEGLVEDIPVAAVLLLYNVTNGK